MASERSERRLAAIMAADIVGYSRLIEADEAGTLSAIRSLRADVIDPVIGDHKGRIVKLMGDGMIAEFASVVDAVAGAVAMQKAVAERQVGALPSHRIVFRIGINLAEPLDILRRNESEVPPVSARKLVAVYLAVLEGSPFMTVALDAAKLTT